VVVVRAGRIRAGEIAAVFLAQTSGTSQVAQDTGGPVDQHAGPGEP